MVVSQVRTVGGAPENVADWLRNRVRLRISRPPKTTGYLSPLGGLPHLLHQSKVRLWRGACDKAVSVYRHGSAE
jgi:hypothetical protein